MADINPVPQTLRPLGMVKQLLGETTATLAHETKSRR